MLGKRPQRGEMLCLEAGEVVRTHCRLCLVDQPPSFLRVAPPAGVNGETGHERRNSRPVVELAIQGERLAIARLAPFDIAEQQDQAAMEAEQGSMETWRQRAITVQGSSVRRRPSSRA